MLQGLSRPAHCGLYVVGLEGLRDNSALSQSLEGNWLSMEAGWDAEGRCWILTCVVLLHKVLSGCHCSCGPAIAACGVLRGGQGYKERQPK